MKKLHEQIKNITQITDRENANVGNSPSAKLLQIAESASREYALDELPESKRVIKSMVDNKIYPHDYSWMAVGSTTCLFIPFGKLLKNGFNTGHGFIRTPKRINKASNLYCIIFQSNQNTQHGGQASGWFEQDLAPYVLLEYEFQYKQIVESYEEQGIDDFDRDKAEQLAWKRTDRETYQAMEALVHNLNSMHSRAGK